MFRLNKSAFRKQTFQEADHTKDFWLSKSVDERLQAAFYLQSITYGFNPADPPRMNKTVFSKRKLSDESKTARRF